MRYTISGAIRRLGRFMLVVEVLHLVAYLRFAWLYLFRRKLTVAGDAGASVAENTILHNLKGMRRSITRVARSNVLIRPLSVIPRIQTDLVNKTVLSIGPRSEAELLSLMAHGFSWENIRGVDLISYSPRIDIGDMHELAYPDNSFDVVIASRVLGYSNAPGKAAAEMVRVVRDQGLVAINTGAGKLDEARASAIGYVPGSDNEFRSLQELLDLYEPHVDQVYFCNDPSQESGPKGGPILAIFSVSKAAGRSHGVTGQ